MIQSAPLSNPTAQSLIWAVKRLADERAVADLSSRAVAEHAGLSPSAVNYTFGSLDQLITSASFDADARRSAEWESRTDALTDLSCKTGDFGPVFLSATRDVATRQPGEEALFWADIIKAARLGLPLNTGKTLISERRFWTHLLADCSLDTVSPDIVQAFSLALRFDYHIFRDASRFDPWAIALANRFAERLTGGACDASVDSAHRKRVEETVNLTDAALAPTHSTARQILDTAIQIILRDGAQAATFREIAQQADLSVSSVQHFFGSRRAYLAAAFSTIYESARDRVVPDTPAERSLNISGLVQRLTGETAADTSLSYREYAAMQGLMLSASRESELRPLAEGLLARAGQTSFVLLRALTAPRGQISRLDAQLFSLISTHFITLEIASASPEDNRSSISSLTEHLLEVFFS